MTWPLFYEPVIIEDVFVDPYMAEAWQAEEWAFMIMKPGHPWRDDREVLYYQDIMKWTDQAVLIADRKLNDAGEPILSIDFTFGFSNYTEIDAFAIVRNIMNEVVVMHGFAPMGFKSGSRVAFMTKTRSLVDLAGVGPVRL